MRGPPKSPVCVVSITPNCGLERFRIGLPRFVWLSTLVKVPARRLRPRTPSSPRSRSLTPVADALAQSAGHLVPARHIQRKGEADRRNGQLQSVRPNRDAERIWSHLQPIPCRGDQPPIGQSHLLRCALCQRHPRIHRERSSQSEETEQNAKRRHLLITTNTSSPYINKVRTALQSRTSGSRSSASTRWPAADMPGEVPGWQGDRRQRMEELYESL